MLRAALPCMGQRDAPFNPPVFAVWYEVAAGTNIPLSRAIDECIRSEPRFGVDTMARLSKGKSERLLVALIAFASTLEMKVVAEGVESEQQADFCILHGCDLFQGCH